MDELRIAKPKLSKNLEEYIGSQLMLREDDMVEHQIISHCDVVVESGDFICIKGVVFSRVNFSQASLYKVELTDVRFENCDLSRVNFIEAILHRVEFLDCKMMGINMRHSNLQQVLFERCIAHFSVLNEIKFKEVILSHCQFDQSHFQDAKINKIWLDQSSFRSCQFTGTKLKDIDFSESDIEGIMTRIEELEGVIVSPFQALQLSKLMGLMIKDKNPES